MVKRFFVMLLAALLCLPCALAERVLAEMSMDEIVFLGLQYKEEAERSAVCFPEEAGMVEAACDYYGELAAKWLMIAAEAGNPWAMTALGEVYLDPLYQPANRELAVAWLTKAAEAGNIQAMTLLGQEYPFNEERRILLEKAADGGSTEAMMYLASMEQMGLGYADDPDRAAESWYLRALEAGEERALEALCLLYQTTDQMDQAKALCGKYAEMGNVDAMEQLAGLYLEQGPLSEVPQEQLCIAAAWYRKAAEAGSIDAMYMLGSLYRSSYSAIQDEAEARFWMRCAALHGHEDAQSHLEHMD